MRGLLSISKSFFVSSFFVFLCLALIVGVVYRTTIVHELVRGVIETELNRALRHPVAIESLEGNLVTQIELKNVRIFQPEGFGDSSFLELESVLVDYNPLKLISAPIRPEEALVAVHLKQGALRVIRSKDNRWNFFALGAFEESDQSMDSPVALLFSGKVMVHELDVHYTDHYGWYDQRPEVPFEKTIRDFSGKLDFKRLEKIPFQLVGYSNEQGDPFTVNGDFSLPSGRFDIDFTGLRLDTSLWAPYVIPDFDFDLFDHTFSIEGTLRNKEPWPSQSYIPFWYDLRFQLENSRFKIPFFDPNFLSLDGNIVISNARLVPDDLRPISRSKRIRNRIWNRLSKHGVLLDDEVVTASAQLLKRRDLKFPKSLRPYEKSVLKLVQKPPSRLLFQGITGTLESFPVEADGYLRFDTNKIDLEVRSPKLDIALIKTLFPTLDTWVLGGKGRTKLKVYGSLLGPVLSGTLHSNSGEIYGFKPKELELGYRFWNQKLDLSLDKGFLYDGALDGRISLDFSTKNTLIDGNLMIQDGLIGSVFPSLEASGVATGSFGLVTSLNGTVGDFDLYGTVTSNSLTVYHQSISTMGISSRVEDVSLITIEEGSIFMNGSSAPVHVTGSILNFQEGDFSFRGTDLPVVDLFPSHVTHPTGSVSLSALLHADMTDLFWTSPSEEVIVTVNLSGNNMAFMGHAYDRLESEFVYDKGILSVARYRGDNGDSYFSFQGKLDGSRPVVMDFKAKRFDLGTFSPLQNRLSDNLAPLKGLVSGRLSLELSTPSALSEDSMGSFLDAYVIDGDLQLLDGQFRTQRFYDLQSIFRWDGSRFDLNHFMFKEGSSSLSGKGYFLSLDDFELVLNKGSVAQLSDFDTALSPFGQFLGQVAINGNIKGRYPMPDFSLSLDSQSIKGEFFELDRLDGTLSAKNSIIQTKQLNIHNFSDHYVLKGYFDLESLFSDQGWSFKDLNYDVLLDIKRGNLLTISTLIDSLYREIQARQFESESSELVTQTGDVYQRGSSDDRGLVYFDHGSDGSTLDYFQSVKSQEERYTAPPDLGLQDLFSGDISGKFHAISRKGFYPSVFGDLKFKQSRLSFLKARDLSLKLYTPTSNIIYSLGIKDGRMGGRDFSSLASKGTFTQRGVLDIASTKVKLKKSSDRNVLSGTIPIGAYWDPDLIDEPIDLDILFKDDDLSVLAFLTPAIESIENTGLVHLRVEGPLYAPSFYSKAFELNDASVYFSDVSPFKSPFRLVSANVAVVDNAIRLGNVEVKWRGEDTQNYAEVFQKDKLNHFSFSGTIGFDNVNLLDPTRTDIMFDLALSDSRFYLNFPGFYQGKLHTDTVRLKGAYPIAFSEEALQDLSSKIGTVDEVGPLFSGTLHLSEGKLALPSASESEGAKPSFLFDLGLNIGKSVSVSGSLFGEGLLASLGNYLDMTFQPSEEPIVLGGSTNAPKLTSTIYFKEGFVDVLNQSFELINEKDQLNYFRDEPFRVADNSLSFKLEASEGKEVLTPVLNMMAFTSIQPELVTSNESISSTKYNHVLVHIHGPLLDLEDLEFSVYESPNPTVSKTDSVVFLDRYLLSTSRNDLDASLSDSSSSGDSIRILELMVPELASDTDDETEGGLDTGDKTSRIIGGSIANQINARLRRRVFQPIEKQIAKNIGIDEFRVNYDVGKALLRSTGVQDQTVDPQQVEFNLQTRLFFKNLFLKVRSDLAVSSERTRSEAFQLSEVELSYYISQFSINFANVRDEENLFQMKQKVSLKYSLEF